MADESKVVCLCDKQCCSPAHTPSTTLAWRPSRTSQRERITFAHYAGQLMKKRFWVLNCKSPFCSFKIKLFPVMQTIFEFYFTSSRMKRLNVECMSLFGFSIKTMQIKLRWSHFPSKTKLYRITEVQRICHLRKKFTFTSELQIQSISSTIFFNYVPWPS